MASRPLLKRIDRALRDSVVVQVVVAQLLAGYLRLVYYTTRWDRVGQQHLDRMWTETGFIASVWHARLFPIAMLRRSDRRAVALISPARDGDLLARVMAATGADAIRASSRDPKKPDKDGGGAAASPKVVEALNQGAVLVITPDGPQGPRMRAKIGVSMFCEVSGRYVLPVAFSVRRAIVLKTWDRFMIPLPFNRGAFVFGEPISPTETADREAMEVQAARIEAAMMAVTTEADRLMGRQTPTPGPTIAEWSAARAARAQPSKAGAPSSPSDAGDGVSA